MDLDRLEKLARAATPGQWEAVRCDPDDDTVPRWTVEGPKMVDDGFSDGDWFRQADAEFIAAVSPETVLHLIELARK